MEQTRGGRGVLWRRTTLRRAIGEALLLFLAARLLAMVPITFWPAAIFPAVLVLRTLLFALPPVWAALRVVSTRREKMSRRFWLLGPTLALFATLVDVAVSLALGEAQVFGGPAGPPVLVQLTTTAPGNIGLGEFALSALSRLAALAIYYTIAVICTRLANGGFLRFTMPAGKGRVTL